MFFMYVFRVTFSEWRKSRTSETCITNGQIWSKSIDMAFDNHTVNSELSVRLGSSPMCLDLLRLFLKVS